jgi:hypothetical protein
MEIVIPVLIGIALGVGATLGVIFGNFEVKTKEAWAQEERLQERTFMSMTMLLSEVGKLRVALAAGHMTEEGKKVAAMTMAAFGEVASTERRAILDDLPDPLAKFEEVWMYDGKKPVIATDTKPVEQDHPGELEGTRQ